MVDKNLLSDINSFVAQNSDALFRDIARLVAIDSVKGPAEPHAPFGKGPAAALNEALKLSEELGFTAVNCEDMIGYAQLGEGGKDCDRYLATITHMDVVPCGDGWKEDPFTMREREGYIIGRGVLDDKGPSVLCLYAAKYLMDRNIPLRYPVRILLGVDEESGMGDVTYYLKNYPAPLFCFSPDADFPLCNGEKGICHGKMISLCKPENVLEISGGVAVNVIPDKATARVKADKLTSTEHVTAVQLSDGTWQLTACGIGGHASMPAGTLNAIGVLADYILANGIAGTEEAKYFQALSLLHNDPSGKGVGVDATDDKFGALTIIGGVISINEDGHFTQTLDSRYPTTTSGAKIEATMNEKFAGIAQVVCPRDTAPFYMELDKPEVQACLASYNDITGEDAKPFTIGGGTYARDFPNAVSFGPEHHDRPTPDFAGPIHGIDEAACKADLLEALKIYILALLRLEELDY
ncbi:MAG: Sapep family Mn(2+)-dependent dipeptidase [Oscillospiraceae bacterium]|nr:Sapep family Mn(2+)-dependent dipeptidase [Oscillospiraceae bacterium]